MRFFISISIFILAFLSCSVAKKKNNKDNNAITHETSDKNDINPLRLYCESYDTILDLNERFLFGRDDIRDLFLCLEKKAFNGHTESINQIEKLISITNYTFVDGAPFVAHKSKFRGKKIFSALLDKSENFKCEPLYHQCIANKYFRIMREMVVSINELSREEYFDYSHLTIDDLFDENDCYCKIYESEFEQWTYALEKDLIKFKEFGTQ